MCGGKSKSKTSTEQTTVTNQTETSFLDSFNSPVTATFAKEENYTDNSSYSDYDYAFNLNIEGSSVEGGISPEAGTVPTIPNTPDKIGNGPFTTNSNLLLILFASFGIGFLIFKQRN